MIRRRRDLAGSDPSDRLRAVLALPDAWDSCPRLLEAAADPSPDVARAALRRLLKLGSSEEASILRARLLTVDLGLVPDYARTLRGLGDPEAALIARDALGSGSSSMRIAAALALRELRDRRALDQLLDALADPIAGVRRFALEALGALGRDRTIAKASAPLLADRDPDVRAAAVDTILATTADAEQLLARVVGDRTPRVRRRLAKASPQLSAPTVSALLDDVDVDVRLDVLWALVERPRDDLLHAVVGATRDRAWQVRRAACRALGGARREEGRETLVAALADSHPTVRAAALGALQEIFAERIVDVLADELSSEHADRRRIAVYALGSCGGEAGGVAVADCVADPDPSVRAAVAHVLAEGTADGVDVLLERLSSDRDATVRNAARSALEGRGARR